MPRIIFVIIISFFALLSIAKVFAYSPALWSNWHTLDDTASNAISFSWKCEDGYCKWRWKNGYAKEVRINYIINYSQDGIAREKSGIEVLQSGENESSAYLVTGSTLKGVKIGVIASEQAKEKAREAYNRKLDADLRQAEIESRIWERQQEQQRLDADDQRREAVRRNQQDLDEIKRKGDERDEFNRRLAAGISDLGDKAAQGINNYYQVKRDGEEAVRRAREEQRQAQLDAERRERERQDEARREQERARREAKRAEDERQWVAIERREREREQREQQAREQREQERRESKERERERQANAGTWEVGDFKVTAWGSDKLYLQSFVIATVTNSKGEPTFNGKYVKVQNNYKKHSIQYSVGNSSYTDRSLAPGQDVLVPLNISANSKETTEITIRVRYWKGEGDRTM